MCDAVDADVSFLCLPMKNRSDGKVDDVEVEHLLNEIADVKNIKNKERVVVVVSGALSNRCASWDMKFAVPGTRVVICPSFSRQIVVLGGHTVPAERAAKIIRQCMPDVSLHATSLQKAIDISRS